MLYVKNVPGWERALRAAAGAAMIAGGLMMLKGTVPGWMMAGAGGMMVLTGFIGFCPMCAMSGRRLDKNKA